MKNIDGGEMSSHRDLTVEINSKFIMRMSVCLLFHLVGALSPLEDFLNFDSCGFLHSLVRFLASPSLSYELSRKSFGGFQGFFLFSSRFRSLLKSWDMNCRKGECERLKLWSDEGLGDEQALGLHERCLVFFFFFCVFAVKRLSKSAWS